MVFAISILGCSRFSMPNQPTKKYIYFQPMFPMIFCGLGWPWIVTFDGFSTETALCVFLPQLLPNQSWCIANTPLTYTTRQILERGHQMQRSTTLQITVRDNMYLAVPINSHLVPCRQLTISIRSSQPKHSSTRKAPVFRANINTGSLPVGKPRHRCNQCCQHHHIPLGTSFNPEALAGIKQPIT